MYKIMLAEDEPMVLQAMTSTLDWKSLGFDPPAACADGRQAEERILQGFIPDAVITDICMPFVDGVALTEFLAQHAPSAVVVMLTGYDDFAYAHRAIKLKVFDYVLKPITPASLRELAGRLRAELDVRRVKNMDQFDALARERFLTGLLTAPPDPLKTEEGLRINQITPRGRWWLVSEAELALPAAVTAAQSRDHELLRYGMGNIAAELVQACPEALGGVPVKDSFCILWNGSDPDALNRAAEQLAVQIADACRKLDAEATCGVGNAVQHPADLHTSYLQAGMALHYRFFCGNVPCIRYADVSVPTGGQTDPETLYHRFTQAVTAGSREALRAAVDALFAHLQEQRLPSGVCLRYVQRAALLLMDQMGQYLSGEELAELNHSWEQADLFAAATLPQLREKLWALCGTALDGFERASGDDAAMRVRMAEAYIRAHYNDETLSLNTMKAEFAISISYFSAIFKTYTGSTFVEYITQLRIDKAKQLLAATERRTADIAQEVGFADPHYFSITFKRLTGATPREYRLRQRAE